MRRGCVLLAIAAAVAGCSSATSHSSSRRSATGVETTETSRPHTLQDLANDTCRTYADGKFENAQPTTVGEIHAITGGPPRTAGPNHPWKWVLPDLPDKTFAAWCWRRESASHYVSYVVGYPGGIDYRVVPLPMATDYPPRPGPLPVT